ncbi:hypothetical protein C8J57DRAFT_1710878 [Mycena rebaudengoi]|nr:hypothetical protein C8J57DRAFT_1710878 [Mycena rebaudengoi]
MNIKDDSQLGLLPILTSSRNLFLLSSPKRNASLRPSQSNKKLRSQGTDALSPLRLHPLTTYLRHRPRCRDNTIMFVNPLAVPERDISYRPWASSCLLDIRPTPIRELDPKLVKLHLELREGTVIITCTPRGEKSAVYFSSKDINGDDRSLYALSWPPPCTSIMPSPSSAPSISLSPSSASSYASAFSTHPVDLSPFADTGAPRSRKALHTSRPINDENCPPPQAKYLAPPSAAKGILIRTKVQGPRGLARLRCRAPPALMVPAMKDAEENAPVYILELDSEEGITVKLQVEHEPRLLRREPTLEHRSRLLAVLNGC